MNGRPSTHLPNLFFGITGTITGAIVGSSGASTGTSAANGDTTANSTNIGVGNSSESRRQEWSNRRQRRRGKEWQFFGLLDYLRRGNAGIGGRVRQVVQEEEYKTC